MKRSERLDYIVKICQESGARSISDLSKLSSVSEITIRRDIALLENLKLLKREKGKAVCVNPSHGEDSHYKIEKQYAVNREQKSSIGKKAVSLITPGETIIFDSGTTVYYMAEVLPPQLDITAICNGLNIANLLRQRQVKQLIVLGGMYNQEIDLFENISECDVLRSLRAQKAFLSAFGVHEQAGVTSGSFASASMRKKIIAAAEQVILLVDSSKFGKIEWAHFVDLNQIDMIITDKGIDKKYVETLKTLEISLIVA
jgi:DeoR family deoxyribose operon repressor